MSRTSKKDILAKTAGLIVLEQGTQELTLDAVAKRANVSKGGLLYHFPTKDALIEGMVEYFLNEADVEIELEMAREAAEGKMPEAGRWLRAYVQICTKPQSEEAALSCSIIGATLSDVKYVPMIERMYENWLKRAYDDGISHKIADLVCIAGDGCWLYGMYNPGKATQRLLSIRETLLSMIENDLKNSG